MEIAVEEVLVAPDYVFTHNTFKGMEQSMNRIRWYSGARLAINIIPGVVCTASVY